MIQINNTDFAIHTNNTSYVFGILPSGQPEHMYYGRKIKIHNFDSLREKHVFEPGNVCVYDKDNASYTLEDMCLEMSAYGKGDIGEPFLQIVYEDGSTSSDFVYESHEVSQGKKPFETLPGSYDDSGEVEELTVIFKDRNGELKLEMHYYVYAWCDVITRSAVIVNEGNNPVSVKRLMSCQVDFPDSPYVFRTFNGSWAREMQRNDSLVVSGRHVNESYAGTSSSRANPFVMLGRQNTTQDYGECYGFNLIYSGNHYESVSINAYGKTRFVSGINPRNFAWLLGTGERFEAPEAVMTYSGSGYNGMSHNMHNFVREHIVRGSWKKKERPVLLNSWEASYFDINERKLLSLAKAGKDVGIELFVMDDGWFGKRNDDTTSLGDWYVNTKKLPGGLSGICNKIKALGLGFGIWVEPEMISVDSDLYRAHPDWAMDIPGKNHSEGRRQRILDLTREDVQNYIIDTMSEVFASADISYVKWDMNRIFTDYYSKELPSDRQQEVAHRYVLGLYHCLDVLTKKFPKILFEGCSGGGNRFDLGVLCYFPQIWASDDTDALSRVYIQEGYSYGYPMSVMSAHVSSCPNHQTLRITPIETRFNVAAFGVCGYECNLKDMKKEDLDAIKEQIDTYKKWRKTLMWGDFYRGRSFMDVCENSNGLNAPMGNLTEWTCVSADGTKAVGFIMNKLVYPNVQYTSYAPKGLKAEVLYHFYNRPLKYNIKVFGDLVNTVSPIHIKQDSIAHNLIAHFVKMDGEVEDVKAYGDSLMYAGVKLKPTFSGTGYNENVRHFQDFASRLYFMEKITE